MIEHYFDLATIGIVSLAAVTSWARRKSKLASLLIFFADLLLIFLVVKAHSSLSPLEDGRDTALVWMVSYLLLLPSLWVLGEQKERMKLASWLRALADEIDREHPLENRIACLGYWMFVACLAIVPLIWALLTFS